MPKPKKFLTDNEIEEHAAQVLDDHVGGGMCQPELPIDIDTLTECDFRFRVCWAVIKDPPNCRTYGTLVPLTQNPLHVAELTLNQNHQDFLLSHPEIERLTRGHELCHWVVHIDEGKLRSGDLPFEEIAPPALYHRMNYAEDAENSARRNRLARFALTDERAYRSLKPRESGSTDCIEPAWMHRQAEHFSACLLVPRQPLFRELEKGDDQALYGTHVRLAETFGVSKRVVQIRLKKLGIIREDEPGRFSNVRVSGTLEF